MLKATSGNEINQKYENFYSNRPEENMTIKIENIIKNKPGRNK